MSGLEHLPIATVGMLSRPHEGDVFGACCRALLVKGPADAPAILGGSVRLAHALVGRWRPAPATAFADSPLIVGEALRYAEEILGCSPSLEAMVKHTISILHPSSDQRLSVAESVLVVHGTGSCHSIDELPGALWCTVDCPLAVAQALVHEAAHTRLRLLGLPVVGTGTLILNPVAELFPSPILKRKRPMSAVLHAAYSFAHVAELDLAYLRSRYFLGKAVVADALRTNLERLASGYWTMKLHAKLDQRGTAFCGGLLEWIESLVGRSSLALATLRSQQPVVVARR